MHISVLLEECLDNLNLKEDSIIVDCTLGYGGHSSHILKKIKRGFLFAFDQDEDAIKYSKNRLDEIGSNYTIIKSNFVNLKEELIKRGVTNIDGIMFDLGVSSPQLDDPTRGFSFHEDARLDMRMDTSQGLSAYEVVNDYSLSELIRIIKNYGEEKYASLIAKAIVSKREIKKIETTLELVNVIQDCVPSKYKRLTHPARRTFQAIRIEVNKELSILPKAFEDAISLLKVGGVISVITFHSLEDKICKDIFAKHSKIDDIVKGLPVIPDECKPELKVYKKIKPSKEELEYNNRSRSATLRVAVKERMI